jgi:tryptophan synthase alpha chain
MSRIGAQFRRYYSEGRKGFIPFITAGDPDLPTSLAISLKLAERAQIIELGVPFSDPMADGPVIQRSSERAVSRGVTLANVLELALQIRQSTDVPLVLFSYFNPVLSYGLELFARAAAGAGIDGVLITDVVGREADVVSHALAAYDIDLISLVAPTTTDARLPHICKNARGFIYAVARNGTTGQQESSAPSSEALVARVRKYTNLPVCVGFGISSRGQIADVWKYADSAVVGSAIVAEIERGRSGQDVVSRVERLLDGLLPTVAKTVTEN